MPHSSTTGPGADEGRREKWIVARNLVYREVEPQSGRAANLSSLDLFFTMDERQKRVVVYLHGGRWIGGDKSEIEEYPRLLDFLIGNGCLVASVNFSLMGKGKSRTATYQDQARDIAAALQWLTLHVGEYGARPEGFILLGFSSGAHLAALIALDERYLGGQGLDGALVRSVIAMDVHAYDIPAALDLMEDTELRANIPLMISLFGKDRREQEAASPATYVANVARKSFLLFSCALAGRVSQTVSKAISESFKDTLIAHGHEALHDHLPNHDHHAILSRFGKRHDGVSEKVKIFLDIESATHCSFLNSLNEQFQSQPPSRERRLEAVLLSATSDLPAAEIARDFGVSVDELYAWKKEFKKGGQMKVVLRGGKRRGDPLTGATGSGTRGGEISEEKKQEAVRLMETGDRLAAQIAQELGVRVGEVYAWKKKFKMRTKKSDSPSGRMRRTGSPMEDGEFSEEFKREAVRLLGSSSRPAILIARELKVPVDTLKQWRKQYMGVA